MLFLIFSGFVAYGQLQQMLLAGALLLLLYLGRWTCLQSSWRMLKRMRWLFISIFILYLGFTPGTLILPQWPAVSPSVEGLELGCIRVAALILVVMAVNLLLQYLSREELVSAVLWLLYPVRNFIDNEKLAVRISLTMELLAQVSMINTLLLKEEGELDTQNNSAKTTITQRMNNMSRRVSQLFETVIEKAESMPVQQIELPEKNNPPWLQWLYPLALLGLLNSHWVLFLA